MEENKTEFINGLIFKRPSENAPDFVKGKLSIKRLDLIEWLNTKQDEWINIDLLESKKGTYYSKVNTYKKEAQGTPSNEPQAPLEDPFQSTTQVPF